MISFIKHQFYLEILDSPLRVCTLLASVFFIFTSCEKHEAAFSTTPNPFTVTKLGSFTIPSNGYITIAAHHKDKPLLIAHNHSTREIVIYDYETQSTLFQSDLNMEVDWSPGAVYSLGFYKEGFYALGMNGLFYYQMDGVGIKAWKNRMTTYGETTILPSFILSKGDEDFLIAKYRNYFLPADRDGLNYWDNVPFYRYLSQIHLDMESDSLKVNYFTGYAQGSDVPNKLPTYGLLFTVTEDTVNVIFRGEPKIWQVVPSLNQNEIYASKPMHLHEGKANYFITPRENYNSLRVLAENPTFDSFHLDLATGAHYFQYRPPFDEVHWPSIAKLGLIWLNEEGNRFIRSRFVKYNRYFEKEYELDALANHFPGFVEWIHNGILFVESDDEADFGATYYLYRLEAFPKR
jgi:hypothetical protein